MDSGASFHTTPFLELLSNYVPGKFGKVDLTNGKSLDIIRIGDINIRTSNENVWTLNNVRHIPTLKRNLISIGQLDDEGHYTTFRDRHWKVMKGNFVVVRGKKQESFYMIADEDMSEKGMKLMVLKGKIPTLKHVDVGPCKHCIFGKQNNYSTTKVLSFIALLVVD